MLVMIPSLGAALIAISRIMDARHHPFDVIFGSLLGIAVAYGSYRQYFPPIGEPWRKGRAYPIRSWASEPRKPRSDEREVARNQWVEPLRTATFRRDEEQPEASFTAPNRSSRQASYAKPEGNVFRQQISKSQRLRQEGFGHRDGLSASSAEDEPRSRIPLSPKMTNRRGD